MSKKLNERRETEGAKKSAKPQLCRLNFKRAPQLKVDHLLAKDNALIFCFLKIIKCVENQRNEENAAEESLCGLWNNIRTKHMREKRRQMAKCIHC
jgi:hypothetical protein